VRVVGVRRLHARCCQILKESFEPLPEGPPAANFDAAKELSITYGPFSFEDLCKAFDERPAWQTLVGESAVAAEPSLVDCMSPTVAAAAAAPTAATLSSAAPSAAAAASEPAAPPPDPPPGSAVPSGDNQI
jgi:hypothetical protein